MAKSKLEFVFKADTKEFDVSTKSLAEALKKFEPKWYENLWYRWRWFKQDQWGKFCVRFGYCYHHGWGHKVERFHQNTAYVNPEANYVYGCDLCKEESDEYWAERWRDYYSSIM